jgi:protein O-mannosyl-transferase
MRRPATQSKAAPTSASGPGVAWPRFPMWLLGVLLVLGTVLAYQPVWRAGFIWDDDQHLTNNPCVVGPAGLSGIWTSSAARICPLVLTSFWVQHKLWGLQPLPYHLFTLLLHAGSALVLWRVLVRLRVPGAWLGAALWAWHPVQVESVAWITELKNTQSGLFYMLAGLFFVRARSAGQARWNDGAAVACAALAMASKSSTVILPLMLGLCEWWLQRGWQWRSALRLAPYLALAAASSALALWTQGLEGARGAEWVRSWPERFLTAGKVVWFYLGKLAWPHPLIFIYPKWAIDARQLTAWLPLALLLVVLVVLWRGRQGWSRGLFMAFACFVVALLPVLGLANHYFLRYSFVGDHFQYLAAAGPLALAGAVLTAAGKAWGRMSAPLAPLARTFPTFWSAGLRPGAAENIGRRRVGDGRSTLWESQGGGGISWPGLAAGAVLLLALAVLTWKQAFVYADEETLWRDTLASNPACWPAYNNLGTLLEGKGQLDEAIRQYQEALRLNSDNAEARNNLGSAFTKKGQGDEAIRQLQEALRLNPDIAVAHNNLGIALAGKGQLDEAIRQYQEALRLKPDYAQAHNNLGGAFYQQGRTGEAIGQFQEALRLDPDYANARKNLDLVLAARAAAAPPPGPSTSP